MGATRRRKRRPNRIGRQRPMGARPDSSPPPKRGVELVDEEALASGLLRVRPDNMKKVGLACPRCGYRTVRKGNSAKQALRAHLKRHVRDRRAATRPLIAVFAVLLIAAMIASVPALADQAPTLEFHWPLENGSLASRLTQFSFAAVCIVLAGYVLTAAGRFVVTGKSAWSKGYRLASRVSMFILLLASSSQWLLAGEAFYWPWLAAVLLPWAAIALTVSSVSSTRLAVKRREFSPSNRLLLFRSNDRMTDLDIRRGIRHVRHAIRDGRFKLERLSLMEFKVISRLGLGDELPDPDLVEARLEEEEVRRQSRFARQERDRRRRRR